MNKRILLETTNGSKTPLFEMPYVNTHKDIKRIWTLYDAAEVVRNAPFSPFTGEKITNPLDATLSHRKGVFLEDYVHDWNITSREFHIYSRVVKLGNPITLLIELHKSIFHS